MRYVHILAKTGNGDCDCCGSYQYGEARICVDGDQDNAYTIHLDEHFGGNWDGSERGAARFALGLCGIAPHINGELPEDTPIADSGVPDSSGSNIYVRVHELVDSWARHDIELQTLADDPHYPTPVRAQWLMPNGQLASHEFADGEWRAFWDAYCRTMIQVDFEHESLDADDDDWDM
jgi:hypothetical protein